MPVSTSAAAHPVAMTAEIVSAFVSNNSLPPTELVALIQSVHEGLVKIANGAVTPVEPPPPTPAVTVRQSIKPDYLVCLDDGKRFKSLRRHLTTLGMTAEQYRAKWSLPADYPMVAANYAAQRSAMAKKIGLGQLRNRRAAVKQKRGRPAKASA
jgi:predicted transcriptional regulator